MRHLDSGAGEHAEAGPVEQRIEAAEHAERGGEQHEAVGRIGIRADLKAAERGSDAGHGRAYHNQGALGRNQAKAPGSDDGVEGTVIEMADHHELNQRADQGRYDSAG